MSLPKKPRCCRICKEMFQPRKALQNVCSFDCEVKLGIIMAERSKNRREKAERVAEVASRKIIKGKLEAMKTRSQLIKALGLAFRAWVRARDEGRPCISCDKILTKTGKLGGDYDAGHYRSVGSAKHLEFDERNVHGQCKYCNDALKSNPQGYRPRLIQRIGMEAVEALEADQEDRKYSKDDLRNMKAHYVQKLKELQRGN